MLQSFQSCVLHKFPKKFSRNPFFLNLRAQFTAKTSGETSLKFDVSFAMHFLIKLFSRLSPEPVIVVNKIALQKTQEGGSWIGLFRGKAQ